MLTTLSLLLTFKYMIAVLELIGILVVTVLAISLCMLIVHGVRLVMKNTK